MKSMERRVLLAILNELHTFTGRLREVVVECLAETEEGESIAISPPPTPPPSTGVGKGTIQPSGKKTPRGKAPKVLQELRPEYMGNAACVVQELLNRPEENGLATQTISKLLSLTETKTRSLLVEMDKKLSPFFQKPQRNNRERQVSQITDGVAAQEWLSMMKDRDQPKEIVSTSFGPGMASKDEIERYGASTLRFLLDNDGVKSFDFRLHLNGLKRLQAGRVLNFFGDKKMICGRTAMKNQPYTLHVTDRTKAEAWLTDRITRGTRASNHIDPPAP